jgi:hypothetical protein
MKIVEVYLPSVAKVQGFVNALSPLEGVFELFSDNLVIDAKSLMGIFGFYLKKPIKLRICNDSPENMAAVAPFIVGGIGKL